MEKLLHKIPLTGWVWSETRSLTFNSVFCPFAGNATLATMFKEDGKEVILTDLRLSKYRIGKALVENSLTILDPFDVDELTAANPQKQKIITALADTYGIRPGEAEWLDNYHANIEKLTDDYKKDLAHCIAMKIIHYIFSLKGEAAGVQPEEDLTPTFCYYLDSTNDKIFSNNKQCIANNDDANELVSSVHTDAMYFYAPHPSGCMEMGKETRLVELFNHYCSEGELGKQLKCPSKGLGAVLKDKKSYCAALEEFLERATHIPLWIICSNAATRLISDSEMTRILEKFKKNVKSLTKELFLGKDKWTEYLFIATD
ncbi:MAG: hypothetical protein AB1546_14245 [bacterium]